MAKPAQEENDWSRQPKRPIHECAQKLDFFCLGRAGPNDSPVVCVHQNFWFRSRPQLAQALNIGPSRIKGSTIAGLSDTVLDLLAEGLGFNARDPHFTTKSAVDFAIWYNKNNSYDDRLDRAPSADTVPAEVGLLCVRPPGRRPQSRDRRLVTVELRSDRNEATLPWPLNVGLTLGTRDIGGIDFFIRAGRLKFNLGERNARTDLPGERGAFPGTLEVVPKNARIKLRPDGDSFAPEWAFESVGGPSGPITARDLIKLYDLSPGDVIEVALVVFVKDLMPDERSALVGNDLTKRGRTKAFVWRTPAQSQLPFRDAKSALLDHVEAIRLLHASDGEATLARDELTFVGRGNIPEDAEDQSK